MIDLLQPKTDADRLRALTRFTGYKQEKEKPKKEPLLDNEERKTLITIEELAMVARVTRVTIARTLKENPALFAGMKGRSKVLHKQSSIALLDQQGIGTFGDTRYLMSDVARIARVPNSTISDWALSADLPERTVLKGGRPAWSSADAEIVVAKFEERLR